MLIHIGRLGSLSMYSKIIGPHPQGRYMGWIFTMGAISRIFAPLFAVKLYLINGPTLMFGGTAILFGICIVLLAFSSNYVQPHPQINLIGDKSRLEQIQREENGKLLVDQSNAYLNESASRLARETEFENAETDCDDGASNYQDTKQNTKLKIERNNRKEKEKEKGKVLPNDKKYKNQTYTNYKNKNKQYTDMSLNMNMEHQGRQTSGTTTTGGSTERHSLLNSPLASPAANRLGVLSMGLPLDTTCSPGKSFEDNRPYLIVNQETPSRNNANES